MIVHQVKYSRFSRLARTVPKLREGASFSTES